MMKMIITEPSIVLIRIVLARDQVMLPLRMPNWMHIIPNHIARVLKWGENQIVLVAKLRTPFQIQIALVAKLRSHFQNQIAIAKNCEIAIAKSCEKLRCSHFELENHSKTWILQWLYLMKIIIRYKRFQKILFLV